MKVLERLNVGATPKNVILVFRESKFIGKS